MVQAASGNDHSGRAFRRFCEVSANNAVRSARLFASLNDFSESRSPSRIASTVCAWHGAKPDFSRMASRIRSTKPTLRPDNVISAGREIGCVGGEGAGAGPEDEPFIAADCVEYLSTMERDFLGGLNAKPHFVSPNFHDDNRDVVIDDDRLVLLAR